MTRPRASRQDTRPSTATAVVVSYECAEDLAVLCPLLAGERRVRPVVVDNGSSDGSPEVAAATLGPEAVIRSDRNLGYAGAINLALRDVDDGPVVVLNPDVRFRPGTITEMLELLERSGAGVLVGRTVDLDGSLALSLRREPSPSRALGEALLGGERSGRWPRLGELVVDRRDYLYPHDIEWATGSAMAISGECRAEVGPWCEDYFLYSEETDYMARARAAGYRVRYDPLIEIRHAGGEQLSSPALYALGQRNRVAYVERRRGRFAGLRMAIALSVGELLRMRRDRELHEGALRAIWAPQRTVAEAARHGT